MKPTALPPKLEQDRVTEEQLQKAFKLAHFANETYATLQSRWAAQHPRADSVLPCPTCGSEVFHCRKVQQLQAEIAALAAQVAGPSVVSRRQESPND